MRRDTSLDPLKVVAVCRISIPSTLARISHSNAIVKANKSHTSYAVTSGSNKDFVFRTGQEVYAVNAIKVHPTFGTFITCGKLSIDLCCCDDSRES